MKSVIIEKASQDEQQNQTTTTTNIKYIQNFMFIVLISLLYVQNLTNKLKIAWDKTETKENIWLFTREGMGPLYTKSR